MALASRAQAVDVVAVSPNVQIRNAIDRALLGILQGKLKEQAAAQVKDLLRGGWPQVSQMVMHRRCGLLRLPSLSR